MSKPSNLEINQILESPFRSLFVNNPDLCYMLDRNGYFIELNDVALHALKYAELEIMNQSFLMIIHPDDYERISNIFIDVMKGKCVSFEVSVLTSHSVVIPLSVTAMPIVNNDEIVGVIGVAKDMTEIITSQKRIMESKKRYKNLVLTAPYPIIVSCNQQIVLINDEAVTVFGGSHFSDFHGRNAYDFFDSYMNEEGERVPLESLKDLTPFLEKQGELTIQTLQGTLVDLEFSFTEIDWDDEVAYIAIFQDITKRKQLELTQKQELLLAHQVQQSIFPSPLKDQQIKIDSFYSPSTVLSGDMYFWMRLNEHSYGILILDIMGHGIPSSLVTMSIQSLLPGILTDVKEPHLVMGRLNQHMYEFFHKMSYFMTGIYCFIDTNKRSVQFVNSGHPSGLLKDANGLIKELRSESIPLGLIDRNHYQTEIYEYSPSSKLILYTDGIFESLQLSPSKGVDFLKGILEDYPSRLVLEELVKQLKPYSQTDDICIISIDLL
ncbi:SpoIIE family protein phosphatase [Bacillus sp. AK128]